MPKPESSSRAANGALGDAAHRVALSALALTRAGVRQTASLVDGVVGGGLQTAGGILDAAGDAARMVGRTLGSHASDIVELRITRLLNAFQIPTSRDVNELARRVERLSQMVAAQESRVAQPAAKSARPGKPRRKTAAPRRKVSKKTAAKSNGAGRPKRAKVRS
jgi:hypothetical protein